jgi:hypothetical protein
MLPQRSQKLLGLMRKQQWQPLVPLPIVDSPEPEVSTPRTPRSLKDTTISSNLDQGQQGSLIQGMDVGRSRRCCLSFAVDFYVDLSNQIVILVFVRILCIMNFRTIS